MTKDELKARDYYVMIDKSAAMGENDAPDGRSRWDYAKGKTQLIASTAEEFDANGIDVCVFSDKHVIYQDATADKVEQAFNENTPEGATNVSGAMNAVFELIQKRKAAGTGKPATIIVMTGGVPDNQEALVKGIVEQTTKMEKAEDLAISIVQIGKNAEARSFFEKLDNDLCSNGAKFDIVDTRTDEEMNVMSIEELLTAAIEG